MSHTIAALNSKGGVGKTTFLANLGGLLADMGARVLLVDADPQPSLTRYFDLSVEAPGGLVEVVTLGSVRPEHISRTTRNNIDLIRSNDGEASLQHWLYAQHDGRTRLARALKHPHVADAYDVVLIDTQGAIGPLQTAAAFAADMLVSPLPPDTPSVREFRFGTLKVLQRLVTEGDQTRTELAPIRAVICKATATRNARGLLDELRAEFSADDRVSILDTCIPDAVAYKDAFTQRRPVHEVSLQGGQRNASGYETMHRIAWELKPELYGLFAGGMRGDPTQVFAPRSENPGHGEATP